MLPMLRHARCPQIEEVRDGIRILQALCAEAKQQQDLELVEQVGPDCVGGCGACL